MKHQNQTELFELSKKIIPGGVHSPVRSFKGLHTTPRFIQKADGAYLYDTEGNDYIDFCMSFGPMILGHNNNQVRKSIIEGINAGWSYGTCEPYSLHLAMFLVERLEYVEQIRFMNSGTEAVMTAIRLARGVTNKNKIIKFNGCYHGHSDSMLIKAGSGLAGTSESSSAGVPAGISKDTLILDLGDIEGVKHCFQQYKNDIAAIIIEPLPANNGLIKLNKKFLHSLREISSANSSLLIFDEVISGFRAGFGGISSRLNIHPDIITYGKIIGGGLPVGAIAGSTSIMEHLAPLGDVYQAGTLSANPLAMIAGLATLTQLTPDFYNELETKSNKIITILSKWLAEYQEGIFSKFKIVSSDSLFWITPNEHIQTVDDIPTNLVEQFRPLFKTLLEKGIYLSPNAYEIGFISIAHNDQVATDLEKRLWS